MAKKRTLTSREITVKLMPKKLLIPAGIVIILAAAIVTLLTLFKPRPGAIDSIAVLPLADLSKSASESSFVDGMHDALINELTKIRAINVIGRRNVLRYKDANKSIPEVARELKVAAVVEGSVVRTEDRVRITVELIDGRTDKRIWGPRPFDRANADILSLYSKAALAIARAINAELSTQDIENLSRRRRVNPEAYKLYLRAKSLIETSTQDLLVEFPKAVELYQRSVEIDPDFALGHANLANIYSLMASNIGFGLSREETSENFEKARGAALRALSLDDRLVDAHAALGSVKFYHDWDFAGAETEYRRAMELGQETFRANIVVCLALVGRFDEAIALQRRIMESNPLYPDYMILEWVYYEAKRFDEAIAVTNGDLEINPSFSYRKLFRSNCYALKGMCVEALADVQSFLTESPSYRPNQDSVIGHHICPLRAPQKS
jgi:TolB-like protein